MRFFMRASFIFIGFSIAGGGCGYLFFNSSTMFGFFSGSVIFFVAFVGGCFGDNLYHKLYNPSPKRKPIQRKPIQNIPNSFSLTIKRKYRFVKKRTAPAPRQFESRLTDFVSHAEGSDQANCPDQIDAVDAPFKSKMKFWSIVSQFKRVPPKSVEYIRQVLMKIRRTLKQKSR